MSLAFGNAGPDGIPVIKGQIPINATFSQRIPLYDADGTRVDLDNLDIELTFRERDETTVVLRLSTDGGEITKTTDSGGDVMLVVAEATDMSNLCGSYRCSLATRDASDDIVLRASGLVAFIDQPAAFA